MTGETLFTTEFLAEIRSKDKNYSRIKSLLIEAYQRETGNDLRVESAGHLEQEKFVQWMNEMPFDNPDSIELFWKKQPVGVPNISSSLSGKIIAVSQLCCPLCTDGKSHPIKNIPIRISPVSKQSISKEPERRAAFEKAIRHRLQEDKSHYPKGTKLCVHVVFVLGSKSRNKDLDNMSKALLDGLKGALFHDDMDIEHLSLVKFNWNGEEDFVTVNIRVSGLGANDDVVFASMHHGWAGAKFLDLDDFLPNE